MKQNYLTRSFILLALFLFAASIEAQVYVKHDATGANNGSSWQNAYTNLETALANTTSGQIWVAAGTYKPGGAAPDSSSVFSIKNSVGLYGGFAGTETSLSQRNPAANVTTLSGDINGDDIAGNFTANKSDNTQHVVYVDSLLPSAVTIDGFRIRGGHTSNFESVPAYNRSGGGIYALSPVNVIGCSFQNNFARSGGCIFLSEGGSNSSIVECSFVNNAGTNQSAGILLNSISGVTVQGCNFENNQTSRGALYALYCNNVLVNDCTFKTNVNTTNAGGAFYNFSSTNVALTSCVFEGNSAPNSGALYYDADELSNTDPNNFIVTDCIFKNNIATNGIGGAFRCRNGSYTLTGCTFENNSATGSGGQLRNDTNGGNVVYQNCSFIKGNSGGWGGAFTCYGLGNYLIKDCLFEDNTTTNLGGVMNCGFIAKVTVDGCTFNNNISLNSSGGAIALQNDSTSVVVVNSEFSNNRSNANGGAIFSGASASSSFVAVDNSAFWANETVTGVGGAISVSENGPDMATLTLSNSILAFNIAPNQGGALNNTDNDVSIVSCLFFNNVANGTGAGAAFSNNARDNKHTEVSIMNTTFADNLGALAGGIADWTGALGSSNMTLQNNIFRQDGVVNYVVEDGAPNLVSNGGNLSDDNSMSSSLTHPKDILLGDPGFVNPDDFDFRLKSGSICIDAGVDNGAPLLDLLGNPRIGAVDIGAYEFNNIVNTGEVLVENKNMLIVVPNPVSGTTVKAVLDNDWHGDLQVRLFDVAGRMVRMMEVPKPDTLLEFNLSLDGVRTGVYELIVSDGHRAVAARLIRM